MSAGLKKRVLFVDDEPSILQLIQAIFRASGPTQWEVSFATSGPEALEMMEEAPYDAVVSDMRMPDMSGVELLGKVMEKHPHTARIILSGYADQELILRSLGSTHQYLQKPFSAGVLQSTLSRIFALERFLERDELRTVVSRIKSLPTLPDMYFKLMRELTSPHATTESIGEIIARDVSLTAKLLQLVNSAFFGLARPVASATEAVQILGVSTIKTLAVSICVFSRFEEQNLEDMPMDRIWRHSLSTGLIARRIAAAESRDAALIESAFTGGVLHDIGKLVLFTGLPQLEKEVFRAAKRRRLPLWQVEQESIGASHAEVGAYLLGLWGLPHSIVETVAWHHSPQKRVPVEFCSVTAVHFANHLENRHSLPREEQTGDNFDMEYIDRIKMRARLRVWDEAVTGS